MTKRRAWSAVLVAVLSGMGSTLLGAGQVASGLLTGRVRDAAGAVIPNVRITVTHSATNLTRSVVAGPDGTYRISNLPPGEYQLDAAIEGFGPLRHSAVRVQTGEVATLDLALQVGSVADAVTVSAATSVLQTERASLGQVITPLQIVQLPLKGRSFISLAALAPGVALPPGSLLPRINGGRPRTNEYLFDGIAVLQPEPGQVAFFPVIDAIHEFKIESNSPPAEFGRFNGGVVNLTTKSGSNALGGSAFGFFRHESLNARNFFAAADAAKPRFRQSQFGAVAGGPLRKDRTFFFADYQGQRQRIGRTVISTVPTLLQRDGIFTEPIAGRVPVIFDPLTTTPTGAGSVARTPFAGNRIPDGRIDAAARALLARFPLPTAGGTANNYRRTADEVTDQDQFDVRVDQQLRAGLDHAFVRLSHFREQAAPVTPLPDGSGVTAGTLGPQRVRAWSLASSYQRVISDRWLIEWRIGDTRRGTSRQALDLPTYQIAGYQQLGSPANTRTEFDTGVTQVVNAFTWVAARHSVKAGLDWRWSRLNVLQPPFPSGLFQFTSLFTDLPGAPNTGTPLASFLLGQVQSFSIDLQERQIRNRAHIQEYFIQDDWKAGDRLTLNGGVRYTLNFPSYEASDQAAVFNLDTQQLEYLGRGGRPRSARALEKLNFGPRAGAVLRVGEWAVVRGGYALVWIEQTGITSPFTTPAFPFIQTVSQRTLDNVSPAFALATGPTVSAIPLDAAAGLGQGVFAVNRALGSGYVQQWNAAVQRQLSTNTSIDLAYVGSRITRVGVPDSNVNQLSVADLARGPELLQRVPNPFFGQIPRSSSLGDPTITLAQLLKPYPRFTTVSLYRNNVGTTAYHGLELRVERRLSRGVSLLATYTRSKLVDDASSVFDASILSGPPANYPVADSFDRSRERDYSTGDIPHVFTASGVVQWRGWTMAAILTLQSGIPVAVTQATNFNAFAGFGTQRPNLVGDPELPADQRTVDRWFNTAAFEVAPQFTLGRASRNPVRGPGYRNLDLSAARRLPVPGGTNLELRVEVFNAINTPPLMNPGGVVGTPGFGTITAAGDPRVLQVAAKWLF